MYTALYKMQKRRVRIIKPPKKIGGKFGTTDWTTSNTDLKHLAKLMSIKNFRGVYDLTNLPTKPKQNEKAIISLKTPSTDGFHWVCYIKSGKCVRYFNSIGNKPPPIEFEHYFKNLKITWNKKRCQRRGTSYCGFLCLLFLKEILYKEVVGTTKVSEKLK